MSADAAESGTPDGDPVKHAKRSSVDISVAQSTSDTLTRLINAYKNSCAVDYAAVDKKISDWFDEKKKNKDHFWEVNKDIWNSLIEGTKTKARVTLAVIGESWNQAVDATADSVNKSKDALFRLAPYGKIVGTYYYTDDSVENGDPGWALDGNVVMYNTRAVTGEGSIGIAPIDISISAGVDSDKSEVAVTIRTGQSLKCSVTFPSDLAPDPADPTNKPIAKTGFFPKLDCMVNADSNGEAVISFGVQISSTSTIDLGHQQKNIEAGKDKKTNEN